MSSARSTEPLAPTLAVIAACVAVGGFALYHATMGWRVVSTEGARRLAVAERPVALPDVMLRGGDARMTGLKRILAGDRRPAIVVFVYTRCTSVCSALGTEMQQMQARLLARGLAQRVRLLTISFDPTDDERALAAYGRRMGANPAVWNLYAIPDRRERDSALEAFGVTVILGPLGDYVHNGAFHIVDPSGLLRGIVDYDEPDGALNAALRLGPAWLTAR